MTITSIADAEASQSNLVERVLEGEDVISGKVATPVPDVDELPAVKRDARIGRYDVTPMAA